MSIYKRYSDKTKSMYSMIKDEKFLDKCMTIWENVPNIIKNLIVNLYIIKISKSWKKIQHKRKLSMFLYTSNCVWFSLKKRWKLLSEGVLGKIYS